MDVEPQCNGRVRVFVRLRPAPPKCATQLAVQHGSAAGSLRVLTDADCMDHVAGAGAEAREFAFDGAFATDATQEQVFSTAGLPVLEDFFRGFNSTILAYGQTGSGKTHTLLHHGRNAEEEDGLLPRVINYLFRRISVDLESVYEVQAAALQVYNEQVEDLLHADHQAGDGQNLAVHNGGLVAGLTWISCKQPEKLRKIFAKARSNAIYAETKMNKMSSRSHTIFQIRLSKRSLGQCEEYTSARLSIVDLAGSERVKKSGVEGVHFKEATAINKSLLALGNVVSSLATKKSYVPLRDSKLTRILDGSIGGNAKTVLLVCASPVLEHAQETWSSFEFASRAMQIEVRAQINRCKLDVEAPPSVLPSITAEEAAMTRCTAALARADEAELRAQHAVAEVAAIAEQCSKVQQDLEESQLTAKQSEAALAATRQEAEKWKERAQAAQTELETVKQEASNRASVLEERFEVERLQAADARRKLEADLQIASRKCQQLDEELRKRSDDLNLQKQAFDKSLKERTVVQTDATKKLEELSREVAEAREIACGARAEAKEARDAIALSTDAAQLKDALATKDLVDLRAVASKAEDEMNRNARKRQPVGSLQRSASRDELGTGSRDALKRRREDDVKRIEEQQRQIEEQRKQLCRAIVETEDLRSKLKRFAGDHVRTSPRRSLSSSAPVIVSGGTSHRSQSAERHRPPRPLSSSLAMSTGLLLTAKG